MTLKKNAVIDLAALLAYAVAATPLLTGMALHEWISLGLIFVLVVHLLLHWNWVVTVTKRFFRNLIHLSRLQYVVDALLLVAFVTVMLSGILISKTVLPALNIDVASSPVWRMLHTGSADAVMILVGVHFALHWDWVVRVARRFILSPLGGLFKRQPQAVRVPVEAERR